MIIMQSMAVIIQIRKYFIITLGRMFAAVGFLQSISGIVGTLLYNNLYPLTLDVWPGLCFLLGAVITIIPIGMTW